MAGKIFTQLKVGPTRRRLLQGLGGATGLAAIGAGVVWTQPRLSAEPLPSGRLIRTFNGHVHWTLSVAFSPDGRTVLSGSYDNTLKLWDVATGTEIRTFAGHSSSVHSVAFSPDGRTVLS